MSLQPRGSGLWIVKAGTRGQDLAGQRFEKGGAPENDLLPVGDELLMHRVITPVRLPEAAMAAMPGRRLREVVETPDRAKGFCPVEGNDHGHDLLFEIRENVITVARAIERGTLIGVAPGRPETTDGRNCPLARADSIR